MCLMIKCNLYEYRAKYKYSLRKLAEITGISKSYLGYLENNEKLPRIDYAYQLADFFHVSVYELFEETKELY